jgi:peptidoglycan/xylan/chitin deacetylase (PgdA/CDA1 family)
MTVRSLARSALIDAAVALGCDVRSRRRLVASMRARGGRDVRVLVLHGTPPRHAAALRQRLAWLADRFDLVDFETFKRRWHEPTCPASGRPAALLTFDDGLASQFDVAAPLLEELGTRGVFFVVPEFSMLAGDAADRFYRDVLRSPADHPRLPLTPRQIRELADRGHTIGSHTFSHVRLSTTPADEVDKQITAAVETLQGWTGRPVESFAWTFSSDAITPEAHRLACRQHAWCFAPCPGLADPAADSPQLIWRTNVEAWFSPAEWGFLCSGLGDRMWLRQRAWLRHSLGG